MSDGDDTTPIEQEYHRSDLVTQWKLDGECDVTDRCRDPDFWSGLFRFHNPLFEVSFVVIIFFNRIPSPPPLISADGCCSSEDNERVEKSLRPGGPGTHVGS
jgi:hypothetical protein